MLRIRTLLVDDEPLALDLLKHECERLPFVEIVGAARDGDAAVRAIERLQPDLVLCDIEMPEIDGLAVAVHATPTRPQFVFVTAHPSYAVDAFGLDATDYLLKPLSRDRLAAALQRVRRRALQAAALIETESGPPAEEAAVWMKGRHGYVRVAFEDIQWIEAEGDYVLLHTPERAHLFRSTLGAMCKRVGPNDMLQVHRSLAVRPSAVREVHPAERGLLRLVLADGAQLPVSRAYVASVAAALGVPHGRRRRSRSADE